MQTLMIRSRAATAVAMAVMLASCGGSIPTTLPAPTPEQVQSVRSLTKKGVAEADLVLTYVRKAGPILDQLPGVDVSVKNTYDCGLAKIFGSSTPASPAVVAKCGPIPLHDVAPWTKGVNTLREVTTCPGVPTATAAIVQLLDPLIASLATTGGEGVQFIALSLQTSLKILRSISAGELPCSN